MTANKGLIQFSGPLLVTPHFRTKIGFPPDLGDDDGDVIRTRRGRPADREGS